MPEEKHSTIAICKKTLLEALFRRRPARAMFGGDRLDDEAMLSLLIEGNSCSFRCLLHEVDEILLVERCRRRKNDVFRHRTAAFEQTFRVRQTGALEKEKAHPLRVDGDGEDAIGGPFGGAEADGKRCSCRTRARAQWDIGCASSRGFYS